MSSTNEYHDDLHEAKATISLQQKQLANYEKLIKKQNDKIQLLRSFIWKHHGEELLNKVEATKSTTSSSTKNHSKSPQRSIPSSINKKATAVTTNTRSNHHDSPMHIRLGQKDMHSFFFDTIEPSSQTQHWQVISSPPRTDNSNASPTTSLGLVVNDDAAPKEATSPQRHIISSQSSHTTDESSFTIEATPQRDSVIVSPITMTPVQHRQQQSSQDAFWEDVPDIPKSPSDRHQPSKQPPAPFVISDLDGPSTHRPSSFKKRASLTSIDINQRNDDQFLKRPASNSEFPYAEVVRKKDERAKLHGTTCTCCAKYFENATSPKTAQERIQKYSRHRERYKQPSTPPGFWDLDFPDSPLH